MAPVFNRMERHKAKLVNLRLSPNFVEKGLKLTTWAFCINYHCNGLFDDLSSQRLKLLAHVDALLRKKSNLLFISPIMNEVYIPISTGLKMSISLKAKLQPFASFVHCSLILQ